MASILLVLTSSPQSPPGQRALSLAESLAKAGNAITLCCLQDAVATSPFLNRLPEWKPRCVVLGEDLEMRGLRAPEGARVVDRAGIVALLAEGHDRVIGCL